MNTNHKRLKADLESARDRERDLLRRIQEAEDDLRNLESLMSQCKAESRQDDYEELDCAYQQAWPDYRKLVEQLGGVQERIRDAARHVDSVEEYLRTTGLYKY